MSTGNRKLGLLVSRTLPDRRTWRDCWRGGILLAALGAATIAPTPSAKASTFKVLYSFCSQANCADGSDSGANLIIGDSGILYGTTHEGGQTTCSGGCGTVFELVPNVQKTKWTEKVIYSFCSIAGCADGHDPAGPMIVDGAGNLYGTTYYGGAHGYGVVFELVPNAAKTRWKEKVLYSFCAAAGCADGQGPQHGVIADGSGNLYGVTKYGGVNGQGTVFELLPNAAKTRWKEKVLYSFCALASCADGATLVSNPIMDSAGNIYGTTTTGGANGGGTVFELIPNAAKTRWKEKVLYSFCAAADCADGSVPYSALIMDDSGDLYGTTNAGGLDNCSAGVGCGTAFELIPNAKKTKWQETVIYRFCQLESGAKTCPDGAGPRTGLTMDGSGNFYGTTEGGNGSSGTLFELVPNVAKTNWTETVLYGFCSAPNCADGKILFSTPTRDGSGNLYGTAEQGGAHGGGVVWELVND